MTRVVFDIGGTNTRIARAEGGVPVEERKMPTAPTPDETVRAIAAYAADAQADEIVGGVAGAVKDGVVLLGPHLPGGWNGFDLSGALKQASSEASVVVMNDAAVAGLGEAVAGAGKGKRIVAYLTVSTGVGGSLVVDGRVAPYVRGLEPGEQIIDYGQQRTLEQALDGASLQQEFGEPAYELPRSVYEERTPLLAAGVYNTTRFWSPEVVVLGGSLMNEDNGFRIADVEAALRALAPDQQLPPLAHAQFGDAAGLYGAALYRIEQN